MQSQVSTPEHSFSKSNDDFDFVDVEGGIMLESEVLPPRKKQRNKPKKKEAATLEEDLQFSSEEELDEVPLTEFEDTKAGILISAEMPAEPADDDSQQAAEAMVQLGQMSYYQQNEGDIHESLIYKGKHDGGVSRRSLHINLIFQRTVLMWIPITIRRIS